MGHLSKYINSSIGKKQIVAVTGLLLVGFVIGHLAGNLFIYAGPEAFNGYAKKLQSLRPGLYGIEFGLLFLFFIHMWLTSLIVLENIRARSRQYAVVQSVGERSLSTRLMPFSGTVILSFVIWHLVDFTFADHNGPRSIMPNGESLGLYGVVYNAFCDPIHSILYIIAMIALGMHLRHGIQSFAQTFGFNHPSHTPCIHTVSKALGILVTVGYSSIPVYILLDSLKY